MATIERFEDLEAWQRARELTNVIYDMSDVGAFARDFGLRDQIRRAAVSVMSNIAEGFESRALRLYNTWDAPKHRQVKFAPNCILHWIASTFCMKHSCRHTAWQNVSVS